jgi:hypothetical protein
VILVEIYSNISSSHRWGTHLDARNVYVKCYRTVHCKLKKRMWAATLLGCQRHAANGDRQEDGACSLVWGQGRRMGPEMGGSHMADDGCGPDQSHR